MPLFYHKYVNYVLAHSVNYVITLYRLATPVAPILVVFANLCKRTPITCLARPSRCTEYCHSHTTIAKEQQSLASHHHTCLPCQREVDWRQGTNLNIIVFTCDMLTIFILQTFLPSRRRDCNTYCALSVSLTPPLTIPQSQ